MYNAIGNTYLNLIVEHTKTSSLLLGLQHMKC